jgi:hypothetical protein
VTARNSRLVPPITVLDLGIEPRYDGSSGQGFCPKDTPPAKHQPRKAPWSMLAAAVLCLMNIIAFTPKSFEKKKTKSTIYGKTLSSIFLRRLRARRN